MLPSLAKFANDFLLGKRLRFSPLPPSILLLANIELDSSPLLSDF
jgi:hypothetical protein